ncbi:PIN domain-containing protein [Sphingomonas sp. MMS12-HWE2-04]|uniref:PIN domain-containing protein n=1 Tax=Sphingomonas sp. MMS12-HWE2-04 TaxID=3234199 RepID=UPI003850E480
MYLLDTPIVFALRGAKAGRTDAGLSAWAAGVPRQQLFLSALSVIELDTTAARIARKDKAAGAALSAWVDQQVPRAFEGRILAIDAAVARRRAKLALADPRDALLAATAAEHGLTLVTRDTAAFRSARIKVFNPWGYTPDEASDWSEASRGGSLWFRNLFVRG